MDGVRWTDLDADSQKIAAVCHALMMARRIPVKLNESRESVVRVALLESWFVNIRLLVEFFQLRPASPSSLDFSCGDFGFTAPEQVVDWNGMWRTASQWVVHMSEERVIDSWASASHFDVGAQNLEEISAAMCTIGEAFDDHLRNQGHSAAGLIGLTLTAP